MCCQCDWKCPKCHRQSSRYILGQRYNLRNFSFIGTERYNIFHLLDWALHRLKLEFLAGFRKQAWSIDYIDIDQMLIIIEMK